MHLTCRRNIINEIMQATAINNLKKAKGVDICKETTPQSTGKGDLLQVKRLSKAIMLKKLMYLSANFFRQNANELIGGWVM